MRPQLLEPLLPMVPFQRVGSDSLSLIDEIVA